MAAAAAGSLPQYKTDLLNAFMSAGSLTFGTYTLKSGRQSPYFLNAGTLHSGRLLSTLSTAFATTISASFGGGGGDDGRDPGFDVVFGPAYKGIPLACTTVEALARLDLERYGDISYCFDRKLLKTYGDAGRTVGSPLAGRRVLMVDDVMTAGTAMRGAVALVRELGGEIVGVVVALDREERAPSAAEMGLHGGNGEGEDGRLSAIGLMRRELNVPVHAVLTFSDIIDGVRAKSSADEIARLEEYREKYKAED